MSLSPIRPQGVQATHDACSVGGAEEAEQSARETFARVEAAVESEDLETFQACFHDAGIFSELTYSTAMAVQVLQGLKAAKLGFNLELGEFDAARFAEGGEMAFTLLANGVPLDGVTLEFALGGPDCVPQIFDLEGYDPSSAL